MSGATPTTLIGQTLASPAGPLGVIAGSDGVVRAAGLRPLADVGLSLPGGWEWEPGRVATAIIEAVEAYTAGRLEALGQVPVSQPGTPFSQRVWSAVRAVPPGETVSYGEIAALAGRPRAARAAGSACGRNRVGLFVPCHRVVLATGAVASAGFGAGVKEALLRHEGVPSDP